MGIPIYTVDAFARERFSGNPAAVCLLATPRDEAWMQSVAHEMNLSETAFVLAKGTDFQLRWFTPKAEVDLCGHATLATAHVLWTSGKLDPSIPARFHTKSGLLTCIQRDERIWMDFPAKPLVEAPAPAELQQAVGARILWSGRNDMDWLLELESEQAVRALRPNLLALRELPVRGLIVTSRAEQEHDFVSRFFAPRVGVAEDPVTGSAHCALGPYWGAKLGKTELVGWQASRRGGEVGVRLAGARVVLVGRALTVLRGELV
ncbi:MAG: PhzF family phenazine biosynthesis protein [Planctomycetes bacterium]|nr:PhzF family phenazine biosynthesis protein [Planctomycetota bacterium]